MNLTTPVFLTALLAGLSLAAQSKPAGAPGPCTLVTKAEIKDATGREPASGKLNPSNSSVCHFEFDGPNAVTISLTDRKPGETAAKALAELKRSKQEVETVSGLGEFAFVVKAYGMPALSVYKGSKVVSVVVFIMGVPEAKQKAMEEALAKKALGRL